MKGMADILEELEKLMYKILIWLILIPKTIVKITLDPGWALGYVKEELGEGGSRFDEYMSPVVLLLIVALIPAVLINFLPVYGVEINSPALTEATPSRYLEFEATTKFKSTSTSGHFEYIWSIQQETVDENGQYSYPIIKTSRHHNNDQEFDSNEFIYFNLVSANTLQDFYAEEFTVPGYFWIIVDVYKVDANGNIIETYYNDATYIYVPEDVNENVYMSTYSNRSPQKPGEGKTLTEQLSDQLNAESTYFLALGLLIPPLIFAMSIRLFTGETISEDLLKDTFYAQCYYFSPISLAIWATYYAVYFETSDLLFYYDTALLILFLPLLLAVIWFIAAETNAIARERNLNRWKALLVVILCLTTILVAGFLFAIAPNDLQMLDNTRKFAIWFYPLASLGLLAAIGAAWFRRLRADNKRLTLGGWALILGVLSVIVCVVSVSFLGKNEPFTAPFPVATKIPEQTEIPATDIQETPTATEPPATEIAIDVPTAEDLRFYTEDFDANLDGWSSFMSSGIESQVAMGIDNGNLVVQLSPYEDKIPWVYLINDAFTYNDVTIEAVVTNNGNNANGVSLVCRFNDYGWYEFQVSNSGLYDIYAYDAIGAVQEGYNLLANGGSSDIATGQVTNVYTAICSGNELALFVNGAQVQIINDTTHNFTEGKIGIGVTSPQTLPIDVQFESLTVGEP